MASCTSLCPELGEISARASHACSMVLCRSVVIGVLLVGSEARGLRMSVVVLLPATKKNWPRSEEHTSELQSLMRISYAVFCLKKKKNTRPTEQAHYEVLKRTTI